MNWSELFAEGGRGPYLLAAFGVFFIALLVEVSVLRSRVKRAQRLREEIRS
ncbi:MAG: heme exporter protein CcmD [Betaproteobacteria bacterium]|nr:heme exporter protein CcmD [Betaproteobacteria bacterium]